MMSDIWDVFGSQLQRESEDLSIDDNQSNEVPINDNLGLHWPNGGIEDMAIEDMAIEDMDHFINEYIINTPNHANDGNPISANDIFDDIMGDSYAFTEGTEEVVHIMEEVEEVEEVVEVVTSSSNESDIQNTQIKPTKRGRGRPKSKLSKEERIKLTRERNKESAKRYRQRKKEIKADKNEVSQKRKNFKLTKTVNNLTKQIHSVTQRLANNNIHIKIHTLTAQQLNTIRSVIQKK